MRNEFTRLVKCIVGPTMEIIIFGSYKLIFVIMYIFKGLKCLLQKEVYFLYAAAVVTVYCKGCQVTAGKSVLNKILES